MIKNLITKNLAKAFDGPLSDAVYQFVGTRKETDADSEINPITGVYGVSRETTYTGRGTLEDFTTEEKQVMDIDISDVKLSALQDEVTGIPEIGDLIAIDNQTKRILSVGKDSVEANWIMHLRGIKHGLE